VARKVNSQPQYQTDRSRDFRPRAKAEDSGWFMFATPGTAPVELILRPPLCSF